MSSLQEIATEEQWNEHAASVPATTLQVIYFHAPWAARIANAYSLQNYDHCPADPRILLSVTKPLSTSWVSMNAEEVIDVSDAFDVTAVPYLVLTRNKQVLETVSGSDASKVRAAIERHAKSSSKATNGHSAAPKSENEAKNTSSYGPSDPATASDSASSAIPETKEDLHKRLANLVKAAPVMLFMKGSPSAPQCGFSRQLVALLRENSVKYGFFNILADDEVRQGLKEFADWPTFPQLWVGGELVGGLDIVKEEISNDPDFLKPYSVAKSTGGPAAPAQQAAPATVTV